uniref:PID domain-containing protein n=1 Tax=Anser cygnoides TaxID=8845 RepID=A0A8B9IJ46_ANSCY
SWWTRRTRPCCTHSLWPASVSGAWGVTVAGGGVGPRAVQGLLGNSGGKQGSPWDPQGRYRGGGCARTGVLACRVQALLQSWGVGWVPELGGVRGRPARAGCWVHLFAFRVCVGSPYSEVVGSWGRWGSRGLGVAPCWCAGPHAGGVCVRPAPLTLFSGSLLLLWLGTQGEVRQRRVPPAPAHTVLGGPWWRWPTPCGWGAGALVACEGSLSAAPPCRDFAYVARDQLTQMLKCHVFRCESPAKDIATSLHEVCSQVSPGLPRVLPPTPLSPGCLCRAEVGGLHCDRLWGGVRGPPALLRSWWSGEAPGRWLMASPWTPPGWWRSPSRWSSRCPRARWCRSSRSATWAAYLSQSPWAWMSSTRRWRRHWPPAAKSIGPPSWSTWHLPRSPSPMSRRRQCCASAACGSSPSWAWAGTSAPSPSSWPAPPAPSAATWSGVSPTRQG